MSKNKKLLCCARCGARCVAQTKPTKLNRDYACSDGLIYTSIRPHSMVPGEGIVCSGCEPRYPGDLVRADTKFTDRDVEDLGRLARDGG